jgi:LysM repeat protein
MGPRRHAKGHYDAAIGTYEVVAGDDLDAIAKRFRATIDELKAQNNLTPDTIGIRQKRW